MTREREGREGEKNSILPEGEDTRNATPHSISEAFVNVAEAGSIISVSDDYLGA